MEPNTPQPRLVLGASTVTLAWSKRSEAILSRHGHDILSLIEAMRKRRTAFYGICLGVFCAMPPAQAPEAPEDLGESLKEESVQIAAVEGLLALIRHAYPQPAEKKSGLKR